MRKRRSAYACWRFAVYLAREFKWPLLVSFALVLGGGLVLHLFYDEQPLSYGRACHAVFSMMFFEMIPLPSQWYLQPLFYVVPIIGLGAIADSIVRLGYLVFTRKQKLQEWQIMQASLLRNHLVVVGAGKVGYRIIKDLLAMREEVVAIDRKLDSPLVTELLDLGVPIIQGEARLRKTLEDAGVAHARAVILATDDDLANLDAALTAREIKPDVRVVLRLFDETLATKVASAFKLPAISTSATSAPAFIAAATGRNVFQSFCLDGGETLHVADFAVAAGSPWDGRNVGDVQKECGVNIVLHKRNGAVRVNPDHALTLEANDRMVVIAPIERIAGLEKVRR